MRRHYIRLRPPNDTPAAQFVPYGRDRVNPPVVAEPAWDSAETRTLARQACFDCHSNETEWPVYASVAPVSWLIEHDISKGRAALNFSEWRRPQKEARDAAEEVLDACTRTPPRATRARFHPTAPSVRDL